MRREVSNFIKNHENKIKDLLSKLIIVAMVVFIATIMLSNFPKNNDDGLEKDEKNVYNPTHTAIKGTDVPEEQYKEDNNIVNKFLEFCNNEKIEEAYNMLSDKCKTELYPTVKDFEENYYNQIFNKIRKINLQAWISTSKYTVYKIRYTNNMLTTGNYDSGNIYEDYITLTKEANKEKISIGSLIDIEEYNVFTKTDEIEATVLKKKTYIEEEEYEIQIKNITDKIILLDTLDGHQTIMLVANGIRYNAYTNKLFTTNLKINPGDIKKVTIKFKKNLGSKNFSDAIEFSNVIKDYELYLQNKEEYKDKDKLVIKLED